VKGLWGCESPISVGEGVGRGASRVRLNRDETSKQQTGGAAEARGNEGERERATSSLGALTEAHGVMLGTKKGEVL